MQVDLSNLDVILSEAFEERAVEEPALSLSKGSAFSFRRETI
jgi:hypothetical protein